MVQTVQTGLQDTIQTDSRQGPDRTETGFGFGLVLVWVLGVFFVCPDRAQKVQTGFRHSPYRVRTRFRHNSDRIFVFVSALVLFWSWSWSYFGLSLGPNMMSLISIHSFIFGIL